MNRALVAVLVVVAAALLLGRCRPSGEATSEIVDWTVEPSQTATDREPFEVETRRGPVRLVPRADYSIAGMVVGVERYRLDASAFLSPLDVGLAWGPLPGRIDDFSFQQMGRFLHWQTRESVDVAEIIAHTANTHTVAANDTVERAIASLDRGDAVRLTGLLVDATGADGFVWGTSLVRTDTDAGACELMWVEEVVVDGRLIQ